MKKPFILIFLSLYLIGTLFALDGEKRPSVALVLGGGGARGFAHVAVLELIEEMGIPVDMIVGVSAGAIVGGLYSAGYTPSGIIDSFDGKNWSSYFQDRPVSPFGNNYEGLPLAIRLGSPGGLIAPTWGRGFSTGQRVYELFKSLTVKIPSNIDFNELPVPFRAGVVQIPGGKYVLLESGDLAEAIRASMSIQGVFEPLVIDEFSYVDGGMINNLPIKKVRELGYDIIIAVDLFAAPDELSIALNDLPDQMSILYARQMSKNEYAFADVVLFPLPPLATQVGFDKGREIYNTARGEKEKLASLLAPIKERIAGETSARTLNENDGLELQNRSMENPLVNSRRASVQNYNDMPQLIPERIVINGALKRDHSFIENNFSRRLKGRVLDEENITFFLDKIYETGNYRTVTVRTDTQSGETFLEIKLQPMGENRLLLRAGLDYEGTFSTESHNRTALRSGIEYQWKDGTSLLMKASIMDELSAGISLFKPLSPYFFIDAKADIIRDQELTLKGILNREEITPDRLLYFNAELKGGFRFNSHNSLALWPEYFWFMDEDTHFQEAGLAAAYTFNNLNNSLMPSRGFHFRLENRLRFSLGTAVPFDIVSANFTALIPMGRKFSLGLSGYGSSLFGNSDLPPGITTFDFDKTNRVYFPHTYNAVSGENKMALSLAFQFEPVENISLLGGRFIFFAAVSAGSSYQWDNWNDFGKDSIAWNASLGAALIPLNILSIMVRAGAGGGNGSRPVPFVSLDLGMNGFQRALF